MNRKQPSHRSKQERRKLRKQEMQKLALLEKRKSVVKKNMLWIISFAIVAATIYGLILLAKQPEKSNKILGKAVTIQGAEHILSYMPTPKYNSNPPTSGPHAGAILGGFYFDEVKDINAVHNLEHGYIWITYKDVNDEILKTLEKIGKQYSKSVLISRREANPSQIALSSWGRIYKMKDGEFDEKFIIKFIQTNKNNSPETFAR